MIHIFQIRRHILHSLFVLTIIVTGCAPKYHPVNLNEFSYSTPAKIDNALEVAYRPGIQKLARNPHYESSEARKKMRTIAIQIRNISEATVKITTDNFKIHSPSGIKAIISPNAYASKVNQNHKGYLVIGVVGAIIGLNVPVEDRLQTMTPAVIMAGSLGWGVVNLSRALNANRANRGTLEYYEIWEREIEPGQSIGGIVIIPSGEEDELTFSFHPGGGEATPLVTYDSLTLRNMNQYRPQVDYVVVPTIGTSYTVHAAIQSTGTRDYLLKADGGRINPEDTKSLVWTRHEKHVSGIPHEGHWIFRVMTGKINAYRFEVEEKSAIDYIQLGDGEIIPYKPWRLAAMVNNDPEIVKLVKMGKAVEALTKVNVISPLQVDSATALQRANQLSPQLEFIIVPTSGTSYNLRTSIKSDGSRDYMEKKDGSRVNPEDTRTIVVVKDKQRVTGVPHEGRWIFKLVSGKINAYASEIEWNAGVEFIQAGNGEIVGYDRDKLAAMAGNDPEVVNLVDSGRVKEAIRRYNEK